MIKNTEAVIRPTKWSRLGFVVSPICQCCGEPSNKNRLIVYPSESKRRTWEVYYSDGKGKETELEDIVASNMTDAIKAICKKYNIKPVTE